MKKVALLTFHFNQNYGAVLQAYATQSFLTGKGFQVEIPDYVPPYMKPSSGLFRGIRQNGRIRPGLVWSKLKKLRRYMGFENFRRQHLALSPTGGALERSLEIQRAAHAVIVGSDQVWNLNWHLPQQFDGYYFLSDLSEGGPKKISYAACFGKREQPQELLSHAISRIDDFDHVFSRNSLTKQIVEENAGGIVDLVVDPTLLPDVNWNLGGSAPGKGYILVYSIDGAQAPLAEAILGRLKAETGLKVIRIDSENPHPMAHCDQVERHASPADWVEFFRCADYVVTDSFHGCVFATKFERNLVAYSSGWRSERIVDFLARTGQEKFFVGAAEEVERLAFRAYFPTDRSYSRDCLKCLGQESAGRLLEALA